MSSSSRAYVYPKAAGSKTTYNGSAYDAMYQLVPEEQWEYSQSEREPSFPQYPEYEPPTARTAPSPDAGVWEARASARRSQAADSFEPERYSQPRPQPRTPQREPEPYRERETRAKPPPSPPVYEDSNPEYYEPEPEAPAAATATASGQRRPKGLLPAEQEELAQKLTAKMQTAHDLRHKHASGSLGRQLGSYPSEPVYSTGTGVRVKGSTSQEMRKFDDKVDAAIYEHMRTRVGKGTHTSVVGEVMGEGGHRSGCERAPGTAPGRPVRGMTSSEIRAAVSRAPQPSPKQIKQKIQAGNWAGPSRPDGIEPVCAPVISSAHEATLAVAQHANPYAHPHQLEQRAPLRVSEEERAYLRQELDATMPVRARADIKHTVMGSSWAGGSSSASPSPRDPPPSPQTRITRPDESFSAHAVRAAQNSKERKAAMMTSSLSFGHDEHALRTDEYTGAYTSGGTYTRPGTADGYRQDKIVPANAVPAHPYGSSYDEDAPRSARVRMQRAMQSTWAELPVSEFAGSNYRQPVHIGFLPTRASAQSAKQRFHDSLAGSVELG